MRHAPLTKSARPSRADLKPQAPAAAPGIARRVVLLIALLAVGLSGCNLHTDLNEVKLAADSPGQDATGAEDARQTDARRDAHPADIGEKNDIADTQPADPDALDADTREDARDTADADAQSDADAALPDAAARVCQGNMGPITGNCRPSQPQDCAEDQTCRLRLNTSTLQFYSHCMRHTEGSEDRGEGQFCTSGAECAAGLDCAAWTRPAATNATCSRLCELESGAGCDLDTEYCANPSPANLSGLGFCVQRCDPQKRSEDCPSDQTCTPDFSFPHATCHPNFRCLLDTPGEPKKAGDPCLREKNDADGCGIKSGLTCVPLDGKEVCVRVGCASDADCPTRCLPHSDGWDLTYCAP